MKFRLICYKQDGVLKGRIISNDDSSKEVEINEEQIFSILGDMKNKKKDVSRMSFKDGNITFNYNNTNVTLINRAEFLKDKNFGFLFELDKKNKKFKISKDNIFNKKVAIGVGALALSLIVAGSIGSNDKKKDENVSATYGISYNTSDDTEEDGFDDDFYIEEEPNLNRDIEDYEDRTMYNDNEAYVDEEIEKEEKKTGQGVIQKDNNDEKTLNKKLSKNEIADLVKDKYEGFTVVYSLKYGLDSKVVMSLISEQLGSNNDGKGILKTDISNMVGKELELYNVKTEQNEKFTIDESKMDDPDYAVNVVCAKYQTSLKEMEGNQVAALFNYLNPNKTKEVIKDYANEIGKSEKELLNDYTDSSWYVKFTDTYDYNKVGNIFDYYEYYTNNVKVK